MAQALLPVNRAAAVVAISAAPQGLAMAEVAAAADMPLTSAQRALEGLESAGVVVREGARYRFADDYPHQELVRIATHDIGIEVATSISYRAMMAICRIPRSTRRTLARLGVSDEVRLGLALAVERLIEGVHPRSIILFGSQARGTADSGSDVDLLVIEDEVVSRQAAMLEALRLINGIGPGIDLLVATPAQAAAADPASVTAVALAQGVTIYER